MKKMLYYYDSVGMFEHAPLTLQVPEKLLRACTQLDLSRQGRRRAYLYKIGNSAVQHVVEPGVLQDHIRPDEVVTLVQAGRKALLLVLQHSTAC